MRGQLFALSTTILVAVNLGGCSNYSASHEYYKARPEAKLEIPPGLDKPIEKLDMSLPESKAGATTYSSYSSNNRVGCQVSEGEVKLGEMQDLRVMREGSFIWLQANSNPESLWLPSREFFKQKGFRVAREDDDIGIIESEWYEYREDDKALRDKFRLRFEFGKLPGTSEIYLSQHTEQLISDEWVAREVDPELEVEMLKRLANYLGDSDVEFQSVESIQTEVAIQERGKKGGLSLLLNHDFDDAWRLVIQAIEDGGDLVEERSINQRFLIARFEERGQAAKARNNSWMGNILMPAEKHAVGRFRIEFFAPEAGHTEVQIQNLQGGATTSERAKRVMEHLQQALAE